VGNLVFELIQGFLCSMNQRSVSRVASACHAYSPPRDVMNLVWPDGQGITRKALASLWQMT
jgi:hypothetical protein